MSFDWKKTLSTVAPTVATALGGPLGGIAARIALDAIGIEGGEAELADVIAAGDPDTLLKLKEAESQFKVEMRRLEIDVQRLDTEDRASARQLATARGLIPQTIISAIFVMGFIGILFVLFGGEIAVAESMMQPAMYVLGILSAGIVQIMNFWFGSSSSSKQKTDQIVQLRK